MKRITFIKIHLYLSGVAIVFMGLMATSGALHLLAGDEDVETQSMKTITLDSELDKEQLTSLFEKELKGIDENYSFDYIKGSHKSLTARPTSRTYYTIKVQENQALIEKHIPSIRLSLMELHKGHGPRTSRPILGILGLIVIGAVLSGLWLGWSSPQFRKITIATGVSGALIYFGLFLL